MIPVEQTILHDPDNGIYGDCFRCAVASILEVPALAVPHFMNYPWKEGDSDGGRWYPEFCRWLKLRGLTYLELTIATDLKPEEWFASIAAEGFDTYHTLSGRSPRALHTVVGRNGLVVHDPHPSKDGLVGPAEDGWHVGFLIYSERVLV